MERRGVTHAPPQAARAKNPELFLSASLLVVIAAALATTSVGLSPIVGALIAGLMIAETDYHGEVEAITAPFKGLALGVESDWQYTEQSATAKPGQIVAMTTDGVIETHNQKNELFGRERFKETMRRNAGQGSEGILKAFVDSVEKFRGETSQHDDITLVVLKFRGDARQ